MPYLLHRRRAGVFLSRPASEIQVTHRASSSQIFRPIGIFGIGQDENLIHIKDSLSFAPHPWAKASGWSETAIDFQGFRSNPSSLGAPFGAAFNLWIRQDGNELRSTTRTPSWMVLPSEHRPVRLPRDCGFLSYCGASRSPAWVVAFPGDPCLPAPTRLHARWSWRSWRKHRRRESRIEAAAATTPALNIRSRSLRNA